MQMISCCSQFGHWVTKYKYLIISEHQFMICFRSFCKLDNLSENKYEQSNLKAATIDDNLDNEMKFIV